MNGGGGAYTLLESRGIIESRPQSGFYIPTALNAGHPLPVYQPPSSFTEEVDEYVIQSFIRATTDPTVIQLAEATPCPEILTVKSLCRILTRVCRENSNLLVQFENIVR